jgi:hypothetical protein
VDDTITSRISQAHENLTAGLDELRRRETRFVGAWAPIRGLGNPWIRFGLAALVGYRLGRPRCNHDVPVSARGETLTHAIVRAGAIVIAQAVVRRAVGALVDES